MLKLFGSSRKRTRTVLHPIKDIIYPDRGGYTGFSLFVWYTKGMELESLVLKREFGGFWPDRIMGNRGIRDYILEGRFFVFGSLLSLKMERGDQERIDYIYESLKGKWTRFMDDLVYNIEQLENKKRSEMKYGQFGYNVHIDEVVNDAFRENVVNVGYSERKEE